MIKLSKGYYGWEFSVMSDRDLNSVALSARRYKTLEEALKAIGHLAQIIDDCALADGSNRIEVLNGAEVHHVEIG